MHARALASIVRVSLAESSEESGAWVHAPEALQASEAFVTSAAQALNDRGYDWFHAPRPRPARTTVNGHIAAAEWDGRILNEVVVAWDGHGLGGVPVRRFASR